VPGVRSFAPPDNHFGAILLAKALRMSTFFTLGHSNHPIEAWIALVRQHRVDGVVDTRSSPYSKYAPQFDKELMQRSPRAGMVRAGA
jgi:hypothetical protein